MLCVVGMMLAATATPMARHRDGGVSTTVGGEQDALDKTGVGGIPAVGGRSASRSSSVPRRGRPGVDVTRRRAGRKTTRWTPPGDGAAAIASTWQCRPEMPWYAAPAMTGAIRPEESRELFRRFCRTAADSGFRRWAQTIVDSSD